MMKPGIGTYDRFEEMFDAAAKEAGKKYFLIPYFIAAHPGTTDKDMMHLALWLKKNRYRADQVQTFLPSPVATATAMYHTGIKPLRGVRRGGSKPVEAIKGLRQRRLHKAFLRYHDPDNRPVRREALKGMGEASDRAAAQSAGASAPAGGDRQGPGRRRQGRRHAATRARMSGGQPFTHEGRPFPEMTVRTVTPPLFEDVSGCKSPYSSYQSRAGFDGQPGAATFL